MQHFSPYAAFQAVASRQPEHEAIVFEDLRITTASWRSASPPLGAAAA